jgi:Tfp pilus assembly protein PilX
MPKVTVTFVARRGWGGAVVVVGAALAVLLAILGIGLLPSLLFGTRLTAAEAEASIRAHLLSQATLRFHERRARATPEEREAWGAHYAAEIAPLKAMTFVSVDVGTGMFSAFKVNRSFVVAVVIRGKESQLSTHYFCFVGTYVTGECSRWHWFFAW